jgi:hypothetical protein
VTWLSVLVVVALVVAVAAITGFKPKGTRHVARTRMMGVARFALVVVIVIVAYLAYQAQSGI